MMFILRGAAADLPDTDVVQVKAVRKTPPIVANGAGKTDYFCVGETEAIAGLCAQGGEVVELRDGWYADDSGGGVAISGHGRYWEVRDTPFTVKEASGPSGTAAAGEPRAGEQVNVRRAVFGV